MNIRQLTDKIDDGGFDNEFRLLYGKVTDAQKQRYKKAAREFENTFSDSEHLRLLSVPGRSEVGGNHTDHNHGKVMACAVDLDIIAVAAPADGIIRIQSEGFGTDVVSLDELEPRDSEKGLSSALIRGVCARLDSLGFITGGFCAYTTSNVLKGSGLSSSAAYEVMIANIISCLYNSGKIDPVVMAQAGQFAESEYFGKPCGLMDQTACAVGGFIAIDFADTQNPVIEKLEFDFAGSGHSLCIVDTGGSHANLSGDYAAIQSEMKAVARFLGHSFLGECTETDFYNRLGEIRQKLGDRAAIRAIHFFGDNARVLDETASLKAGDFNAFLKYVSESGRSSFMYLQNAYSIKSPFEQGLSLALALADHILERTGAFRVHGGGFAGTIQAFVPNNRLEAFCAAMDGVFGIGACHKLSVRPTGIFTF